jgi:hypothetical protein
MEVFEKCEKQFPDLFGGEVVTSEALEIRVAILFLEVVAMHGAGNLITAGELLVTKYGKGTSTSCSDF